MSTKSAKAMEVKVITLDLIACNVIIQGEKGKDVYAAGSVQNAALTAPETSGQVEFYSGPNGTGSLVYTIPLDAKGNFYTTKIMGVNGLYPAIKNATGTQFMGSSLTTGACNTCHGSSTGALYSN